MKLTEIYKKWSLPQGSKQASVDMWDSMALSYDKGDFPSIDTDSFLKILKSYCMFDKNSVVLDVGCGTGRYSVALAQHCKQVIGIDLSPGMLEVAREKAESLGIENVEFLCLDWHELDLPDAGYEKAFDLVFARMTPAIQSADTFMKLSQASRGWCAMAKPTKRTDLVSDAVKALIGIDQNRERSDESIPYAFELLWKNGMLPQFEYEKQQWNMLKSLDDAFGTYINRLKISRELSREEEEKAKAYLISIAENGFISEQVDTIISTMYWRVKELEDKK